VLRNVLDVLKVLSVECVGLCVESVELVDEYVGCVGPKPTVERLINK
jgi:hypothetical protein